MNNWQAIERQGELYSRNHRKSVKGFNGSKFRDLLKYQKRMSKCPTYGEVRFKKMLYEYFKLKPGKKASKRFVRQQKIFLHVAKHPDYNEKGYIGDFYLPKYRILFEVDGVQHQTNSNKRYDTNREYVLRQHKVITFRITNDQTKDREWGGINENGSKFLWISTDVFNYI